ncbi:MAG: hypothetical protein AAGG81_02405, partial [Chlamydiota bacterium]
MAIEPNHDLSENSSLYELVNNKKRHDYLTKHELTWHYAFNVREISKAHEDTLKWIPIKLLKNASLIVYLNSKYARLSDRDFLQINSLKEELLYYDGSIDERTLFISKRLDGIQPQNSDQSPEIRKAIQNGKLTLKNMLVITNESDLDELSKYELGEHKKFDLTLLSSNQKLAIKGNELFSRMVNMHKRDHLQEFLPEMNPKELNEKVLNSKIINLSNLPYGILPILDHSKLSDHQFAELFRDRNIRELDKVEMDQSKLRDLVHRIIRTTTILREVEVNITFCDSLFNRKKMVPILDVDRVHYLPIHIFKIIDYTSLNKKELFHIFHLGTKEHYEKMGHVFSTNKNVLIKYHLFPEGSDGNRFCEKKSKSDQQYKNCVRLLE